MAKVDLASIASMADKGTVALRASEKGVIPKTSAPEEKRDSRRMVNLKPSEYDAFIALLGRQSFSDAVRNLILDHIKNEQA